MMRVSPGTVVFTILCPVLFFSCSPVEEEEIPDDIAITDTETEKDPDGDSALPDIAESEITPDDDMRICDPGEKEKCPYTGRPETENVGPCRAGEKTCLPDGSGFGPCKGEILPIFEICGNGIDDNCDGEPDTPDLDGDGYAACEGDCCESAEQCPDPAAVHPGAAEVRNGIDDNCDGFIDEWLPPCEEEPAEGKAGSLAQAMGVCVTADGNGAGYGLMTAELLFPNGKTEDDSLDWQGNPFPKELPAAAAAVLGGLGSKIAPREGAFMAAFSTGTAADPFVPLVQNTLSAVPADWYAANGEVFPSAPACGAVSEAKGPVYDSVMLKLTLRVPPQARSFSLRIYFLSQEFPGYVCNKYNDFFIALLDSAYTNDDPAYQNPADKNLARDKSGNPVGVNLARSGLFKVCEHPDFPGCLGNGDLAGTGFEPNGGTGWLLLRGNVVPGETITLRLALWDTNDRSQDSFVLIDDFLWWTTEFATGVADES